MSNPEEAIMESLTSKEREQFDIKNFTVESMEKKEEKVKDDKELERDRVKLNKELTKAKEASTIVRKAQVEAIKKDIKDQAKAEKENEDALKKSIQYKIQRYFDTFPFVKDTLRTVPKATASLGELKETLELVHQLVDSQRSLYQIHKYADYGLSFLEGVVGDGSKLTFLPKDIPRPNLTNLSSYYRRGLFDQEIEPLIKEIDIEYPWIGRQSLWFRLSEAVGEIMMKTHVLNTNPEAIKLFGLSREVAVPNVDMSGL